ncbi:hypothetical protein KIL84_012911 [Mauremys mutica]|uniref:Uncharacterized protein n=1 Tax=Mauremys mutica TaxID=74926 RepID=A0A9D3XTH8_9SAUR|nr:hypothetical protein KIL84_012911 [Mauremys mutica]
MGNRPRGLEKYTIAGVNEWPAQRRQLFGHFALQLLFHFKINNALLVLIETRWAVLMMTFETSVLGPAFSSQLLLLQDPIGTSQSSVCECPITEATLAAQTVNYNLTTRTDWEEEMGH